MIISQAPPMSPLALLLFAAMDPAEETVRLLAVLVRMQCATQGEAVLELHRSGFTASRIAELLGTTANTANVTIQRAKRNATKAKGQS